MMTSNWKGHLAEYKAAARATELGFIVCWPSVDCRYDLILDDGKKLWRVQVKSTNRKISHCSGSVCVNLVYETRHQRKVITYSSHGVDALVVYLPSLDKLCWFLPSDFVGKKSLSLRVEPTKNSQLKKIRYAKDYFW